jgi:hypothetical protein
LQDEGQVGFAGGGGIDEGGAFAVRFGSLKVQADFGAGGQAGETGFAVDVGADLEIHFVQVHESVSDVDADFSVVDWRGGFVGDGEGRGAGADGAIDAGDGVGGGGFGVRCLRALGGDVGNEPGGCGEA